MVTYRIDRINKEFLRAISEILQTRIKREDVKDAILTNVNASKDLSYAKVYYTLINVKRREEVQKSLDIVSGQIRALLGREMHLRTIPELHFIYDDSEEKARAMDALLDKVSVMDSVKQASEEE
jgi:ribosome-binding factor A